MGPTLGALQGSKRKEWLAVLELKGAIACGFAGDALSLRRAVGSKGTQSLCSCRESLISSTLIKLLVFSTFPEDWGP